MRCLDCAHADFDSKPGWARHGFNRCGKFESWRYFSESWERECEKFKALSAEAMEERLKTLNQSRGIRDEKADARPTQSAATAAPALEGADSANSAPGWWQSL